MLSQDPQCPYMKKTEMHLTPPHKIKNISMKTTVTFKDVAVPTIYSIHTLKILKSFAEKLQ